MTACETTVLRMSRTVSTRSKNRATQRTPARSSAARAGNLRPLSATLEQNTPLARVRRVSSFFGRVLVHLRRWRGFRRRSSLRGGIWCGSSLWAIMPMQGPSPEAVVAAVFRALQQEADNGQAAKAV